MNDLAKRVLKEYVGTRLRWTWWGRKRRLPRDAHKKMTDAIEADPDSIDSKGAIYNAAKVESLKEIVRLKGLVSDQWERMTCPHPDPGVRLLQKKDVHSFQQIMEGFQAKLYLATQAVQADRDLIVEEARGRLKGAFDPSNYPDSLIPLFGMEVSYPSFEPAGNLPARIAEEQRQIMLSKINEAAALTEQALMTEFKTLVDNLHQKLTPESDGSRKVFRDSTVNKLVEFFERARQLNITGNADLDRLVAQAKNLLAGVDPAELRAGNGLRTEISQGLEAISQSLTPLVVPRPRRSILKPPVPQPSMPVAPSAAVAPVNGIPMPELVPV